MSSRLNILVNFVGSDKLSGAIRNIVGLGKKGAQSMKSMSASVTRLEKDSRKLQTQLDAVNREMADGGDIFKLIHNQSQLQSQLKQTNDQLKHQQRLLGIETNANRIRERGDQLKSSGRGNMTQGAARAAPLILAAKAAGDFSSGMVDIQQKAELSAGETEKLRDTILLAARAARQMPEDMRGAVDTLAGFGLDPRQAALMVPAIGKLGTAFKVDLADGADAAYANLNNLKVPIAQTSRAFDIMAAAGNAGAFEIRDMARHFPGLTSQLRALGDGGLDAVGNLSAALQIARRGTGTADEAANNVKNLLQKINSPATVRAFQKNFGVDLPAEMAKLKAQGIDTFEAIATITQKATKGDLSKLGYAFEDMQAQGAIRNLVLDLKDYRKIRDESMRASGTIDAAFDQRLLTDATVSWRAMTGSVSELAITLGATLLPGVVTVLGHVNRLAGAVAGWAREHPKAASAITQAIAGLALFKVGLGAAQFALGSLFGPLATGYRLLARFRELGHLARVFGVLKVAGTSSLGALQKAALVARSGFGKLFVLLARLPALIGGSGAFGLLAKGAIGFGRALLFVGRALLMNPIGLLVTAIGVAAYLIYRHWDKIKAAFATGLGYLGKAWAWLKANARTILEFSGPIGHAALLIWDNWGTIKKAFSGALAFIRGLVGGFLGVGRAIIDGLVAGIKAAPGKIWDALKGIIGGAWRKSKEFLGIASPSRLFAIMGGHISAGLALGIDRGGRQPVGSMRRLTAAVAAAGALSLSPALAGPPIAPKASHVSAMGSGNSYHFEFHIHARAGQDAEAIAEEVRKKIEKILAAEKRSDFGDDD